MRRDILLLRFEIISLGYAACGWNFDHLLVLAHGRQEAEHSPGTAQERFEIEAVEILYVKGIRVVIHFFTSTEKATPDSHYRSRISQGRHPCTYLEAFQS